jgi:hypothetical protein
VYAYDARARRPLARRGHRALPRLLRGAGLLGTPPGASAGRHCHSTLSLAVIDCHGLGIYTETLQSCSHCIHFLSK